MVFILFSVHKKGYLTECTKGRNLILNPNCLKAKPTASKNRKKSRNLKLGATHESYKLVGTRWRGILLKLILC